MTVRPTNLLGDYHRWEPTRRRVSGKPCCEFDRRRGKGMPCWDLCKTILAGENREHWWNGRRDEENCSTTLQQVVWESRVWKRLRSTRSVISQKSWCRRTLWREPRQVRPPSRELMLKSTTYRLCTSETEMLEGKKQPNTILQGGPPPADTRWIDPNVVHSCVGPAQQTTW